ncbi:MAG: cysteine synthase family protein [Bacteroidia bacterium]
MSTITYPSPDIIESLDYTGSLVGNTPIVEITSAFNKPGVKLYAKLEWQQLGQSVKARAAWEIIKDAIIRGDLGNGQVLLDATSGNTGIAYAAICTRLGIPLTICLPMNASPERKRLLRAYGAELILTSPLEGTDGAQEKARELAAVHPEKYFYADQYNNENNWKAHYYGTAREIYHQTGGSITHFVAALGTTGTFTGTGRKLREIHSEIRLIALQPETAMHGLEGWKDLETARVPGIYDPSVHHEIRKVSTGDAYEWIKIFAQKEGMLLSPSSAANLAGAISVANELEEGVVVTIFPDDGSKYQEVIEEIL